MNQYGRIFFMYINTNYFQTVLWLNKQQLKHICLTCSYMLTMLYERKMFAEGALSRFRVNSNNRKYCGFSLHQSLLYSFALLWWRALVRIISNSFHYFGSWKASPYFLYFCKSITGTLTVCDGLEDVFEMVNICYHKSSVLSDFFEFLKCMLLYLHEVSLPDCLPMPVMLYRQSMSSQSNREKKRWFFFFNVKIPNACIYLSMSIFRSEFFNPSSP